MRKLIVKFLFKILESGSTQYLSIPDKTELKKHLASLYKSGIFDSWMNERESMIVRRLKVGVKGEEYLGLRGQLTEIAGIRNQAKECYIEAEKLRKIAEIKNQKN